MSEEQLAVWRGKHVGVVFQFFQLLPTLTALENAMLPLDFARRGAKRERRERALHNLELVGLADMARPAAVGDVGRPAAARGDRARAGVVSDAGDRRRADRQPRHARPRRRCSSCCARVCDEGATVLYVTHDLELAARANRTITIRDGLVVDE